MLKIRDVYRTILITAYLRERLLPKVRLTLQYKLRVASGLSLPWYRVMEWNTEENFSMEWNMEYRIFSME